jgi:2-polyprenyl-3-methyl-5-hydroxy-6-metoxy-1,4-benzoquinol methylase
LDNNLLYVNETQACNIFSIDVKEDWINDCRNFFTQKEIANVSFAIEDLTNINHQNKFDLIVCVDVMEHIHDDVTVFRNFYDSLKSGGYLLINSPYNIKNNRNLK